MRYVIGVMCFIGWVCAEEVYLKAPKLTSDEIQGTNVGIRPYRKTGVRIEAERLGEKLIVHNYGYGGSGLTLCFGGAREVVEILDGEEAKVVAVLGGGAAGMATAYELCERGYDVRIYSAAWSPHLTSNVAAGIWSPLAYPTDMPEASKRRHQRMLEASEERLLRGEFAGVRMIDSYSFRVGDTEEAIKTKHHGREVTVHFDNGVVKKGHCIQEIGIEGKLLIADLYEKVRAKGVPMIQRHFQTLDEILSLEEPIIINAMSFGARTLFNDQEFLPARGELIYLKPQEGIDYLFYENVPGSNTFWVSVYPMSDRINLGGVYERGEEDPVTSQPILDQILENAQRAFR